MMCRPSRGLGRMEPSRTGFGPLPRVLWGAPWNCFGKCLWVAARGRSKNLRFTFSRQALGIGRARFRFYARKSGLKFPSVVSMEE